MGIQMAFKGMSTVKSPGGCWWREMGCKGRAVGTLHSKVEKGCKGLRNNRREGRAWSPGRDMLGGGAWGGARRGGGLVTWVPQAPGELPCRAGHTTCWQRAGDRAGRGTIEAAPRELSETHSGCCREPWRRNLLVPLV